MNREQKKNATRQAIIDAALTLFAAHGYAGTSVNQIAEAAGVAKGTFFNYFAGKEQVLCDIQHTLATEHFAKLEGTEGPILPLLREALMDMIRQLPDERTLMLAVIQMKLHSPALLEQERADTENFMRMLTDIVAYAQERGEISRSLPAKVIAELAVQTYDGALLYWCKGFGEERLVNQMAISFELFFRGLVPEK
ncbi:TetR/AcrR family transcriptional regulator [Paenibacillus sp. LHD-117]|uniref:TetR/AcrR family transcriptional regulator n=1 Tax=Paenibacillus sp. LHD-117 TaxID=3071412 RepID=UPI0027DF5DAA|nr:TetR/AcrR family transcriptional regulator [Paenibacillus sp. LHD-117]MDQ6418896.1 TetR/AcrR family transcriptional regulator [Paenibacillus sp. LHD-117]